MRGELGPRRVIQNEKTAICQHIASVVHRRLDRELGDRLAFYLCGTTDKSILLRREPGVQASILSS